MEDTDGLILHIQATRDEDEGELAAHTHRLRAALLDLDVDSVNPLAGTIEPDGAKGLGNLIGWLAVQFGTVDGLHSVLAGVAAWAARTGHSVEINYDGDVLKVSRATSAQQERLIDDFIARHAPRP